MHGGRNISIVALAVLAVWFLGGRLLGFRSWEWHQKLVLEVDTPTGAKTGGSTVAIHAGTEPKWIPISAAGGIHSEVKGEASFVEVTPGKYLFAILNSAGRESSTFLPQKSPDAYGELDTLVKLRETRVVPRNKYPDFMTFDDVSDPTSVKRVDPNNLAATFGPGTNLKRITLTITDEAVTDGPVEKILRWLPNYYAVRFVDNSQKNQETKDLLVRTLTSGAFKTKG
ncbi:hypothetical protein [Mesorhizobium sp. B3-2-1]|uniref:hypothetical protein n=1 Tax=Mesorhizobium sp. B3-2-1 TaxID=2589891 RepID=UPI001FF01966|nr:hypothetical protein [Mesorhizobium sp. B3-2-1]